jgi:hypothetical protein
LSIPLLGCKEGLNAANYRVFWRHILFWCYGRLITTMRFQWCYCHCCWRHGRLPFAIVIQFGVGDAPANKEVNEKQLAKSCAIQNRVFFCPLSTGLWYKSYTTSNLFLF